MDFGLDRNLEKMALRERRSKGFSGRGDRLAQTKISDKGSLQDQFTGTFVGSRSTCFTLDPNNTRSFALRKSPVADLGARKCNRLCTALHVKFGDPMRNGIL